MAKNPDSELGNTEPLTVRYYASDLKALERLSKDSSIVPGVWLRSCLRALIDKYNREGTVTVPFVIVNRVEAEKAGLVPPAEESDK
jgi:hypothetical protein